MQESDSPSWPPGLPVLVPVYNHAGRVGAVVRDLRAAGAAVWVVDDGSTDDSGAVAAAAGATVLRQESNRGKGAALRRGFAELHAAGFSRVLTCDADGQHPLAACRTLAEHPSLPHQLLIGRRDMAAAPLASRFGRAFSNFWVRVCCGIDPGDSQSGLRVYPLPDAAQLPARGARYHYEVEIIVRAVWAGLTVRAVPVAVEYPEDRISHFRIGMDNLRTSWAFARLFTRRLLPWPHRRLVPRRRFAWRALLTSGLSPVLGGVAAGVGAALGVAPIPGLQTVVAIYVALRLRLNLPVVLLTSNISFGPLLAFWAAVGVALGHVLRFGGTPLEAYRAMYRDFTAADGPLAMAEVLGLRLGEWALGSVVLMPAVGVTVGLMTAALLALWRRGRA